MKKLIKSIFKNLAKFIVFFLNKFNWGFYFLEHLNKSIVNIEDSIIEKSLKLKFLTPNRVNKYRVNTFFTKEPETLEWINTFDENSVFFDIGANVGLYSCYAAKKKKCKVFAFEPSVFNLEILTKNVYINSLSDRITVISTPVTNETKISEFNMSSTESGAACSTFGESYTYDGSEIKKIFLYNTPGSSMDQLSNFFNLSKPKYIKIDVDGIEHLIIDGANDILDKTTSILIEVDKNFELQEKKIKEKLEKKGFFLKQKHKSTLTSNKKLQNMYNQIWVRE